MNKLVLAIETIRAKVDSLHKHSLKETPTRTIVIDPLLEALGWDVRDPDEVQLEYPTVDGKSVDYGLKLNRKCVLLVEAKAFDDPLNDVKAITQIVNYANNDGITWCILTNGLTWKVYRSIENCPAPDKLMYEISIDPRGAENMPVQEIAQRMWRFSREEIAKGTLDELGEQTFNDSKVRKALDKVMANPPRSFLNLVRDATGDQVITPQQVKGSLARIWQEPGAKAIASANGATGRRKTEGRAGSAEQGVSARSRGANKAWVTRRGKTSQTPTTYNESDHATGKPQEVIEIYRAIDRFCLSLKPGDIGCIPEFS